jgi:hypothetical protein
MYLLIGHVTNIISRLSFLDGKYVKQWRSFACSLERMVFPATSTRWVITLAGSLSSRIGGIRLLILNFQLVVLAESQI